MRSFRGIRSSYSGGNHATSSLFSCRISSSHTPFPSLPSLLTVNELELPLLLYTPRRLPFHFCSFFVPFLPLAAGGTVGCTSQKSLLESVAQGREIIAQGLPATFFPSCVINDQGGTDHHASFCCRRRNHCDGQPLRQELLEHRRCQNGKRNIKILRL